MRAAAAAAANHQSGIRLQTVRMAARSIPAGPIAIALTSLVQPGDSATVPCFGRVELRVDLSAITAATNQFFEPDPLRGGVDLTATFTDPAGRATVVPGFWDGTTWRVRFAPGLTGSWTYRVSARDPSGAANGTVGAFTCVTASARGFMRDDGERFVDARGVVFHGIGHNNGWLPTVEQPAFSGATPAIDAYGPLPAIAALPSGRSMTANGEDLLSFWLSTPWETTTGTYAERAPIENVDQGIGIYNQDACLYLDGVVERAEAAGVYLLPSIWAHDQLRAAGHPWGAGSWTNNAYSLICSANDFMKTRDSGGNQTEQWLRQQAFYRYLIARWGASTAVIGWVGVVEMEGTSAFVASPTQAGAWCSEVRQWFADHDPYRSDSGRYPITFSRSDQVLFDPGNVFNLLATDSYTSKTSDVGVATTLANNITTMLGHGTPCFHSEFGGMVTGSPAATQPAHLHNGVWADFSAGGALSPLLWCDGQDFPRLVDGTAGQAMQTTLAAHARILAQLPFVGAGDLTRQVVQPTGTTKVWKQTAGDHGCAWIMSTAVPQAVVGGQTLTVSGVPAGTYDILWYDTWGDGLAPQVVQSITVTASTLSVTVPSLSSPRPDQFMAFKKHPVLAAQSVVTWLDQDLIITLGSATAGGGAQSARITRLPLAGTLFQVTAVGAAGAAITVVPSPVTNAQNRVLYRAPDHVTGDDFAATMRDWASVSDPATITIDVQWRNHPPLFNAGADQSVIANGTPQQVVGWVTGMSPGTGDPSQIMLFTITGISDPTLFLVLPAVSPAGELTYTPAAGHSGTASFMLVATDDGGTAHGGVDTGAAQTRSITVTSPAPPTSETVAKDAGNSGGGGCGVGSGLALIAGMILAFGGRHALMLFGRQV